MSRQDHRRRVAGRGGIGPPDVKRGGARKLCTGCKTVGGDLGDAGHERLGRHGTGDRVVVETVGTGQAEVRIVAVADRVLLVEGPARGDSIQAEKAGLLELADIVAVNKADLDGADRFAEEIRGSLELTGEAPPVLLVSALEGTGIPELVSALGQLGPARVAQRARWRERLLSEWEAALLTRDDLEQLLDRLEAGDTSVPEIVETFYRGGG